MSQSPSKACQCTAATTSASLRMQARLKFPSAPCCEVSHRPVVPTFISANEGARDQTLSAQIVSMS